MKQAILFDFWQTIFADDRERKTFPKRIELVTGFLDQKGIAFPENFTEAMQASSPHFFKVYKEEQRTMSVEERLRWIFDYCGLHFENGALDQLVSDFADTGIHLNPQPTPFIQKTLAELSQKYSLGIVSDTGFTPGRVLRKLMDRHDLLTYFSAFSFSDETGRAKPHRKTFETSLSQLRVNPQQAIHCGDLPKHDVVGAASLGIATVLYTGCHESELNGIKPDYTISDWRKLPAIVREVFVDA